MPANYEPVVTIDEAGNGYKITIDVDLPEKTGMQPVSGYETDGKVFELDTDQLIERLFCLEAFADDQGTGHYKEEFTVANPSEDLIVVIVNYDQQPNMRPRKKLAIIQR